MGKIKKTILAAMILFCFRLNAQSAGQWKEYSLKQVLGRLKFYAFAKIAQSVRKGVSYSVEREIFQSPCQRDFPKLAENFDCAFLQTATLDGTTRTQMNRSLPSASLTSTYSPIPITAMWYEGSTLAGKGALLVPRNQSASGELKLFYLLDGKLSHYTSGDRIVVFDWKGNELNTILEVKVDDLLRPLSGREYFFQ
ncbi:hypothetical protein LEP1GSC047_0654 [Leptospira inadai serovar Lyme str. 10]|uniref:Uncharacterized protein n=2 Tax=Leptospira inadai serovar Lyme TaxID=293084 RepID=V6HC05_9LEPT|nr:hypothetical protein [Leptospira inadai]EQA37062.1 hypothetical protein LEP1GSC047_0654 [Leptospira inadai serovar Lyme str. 10]PNV76532.1 hypothetical protein BES34_002790 [Leptospira inadai serovar Lyme]